MFLVVVVIGMRVGSSRGLRDAAPRLAAEATLVAHEMQRAAITWHERWYGAFEDAANAFFGDGDVDAMLRELDSMHEQWDAALQVCGSCFCFPRLTSG